MEGLNGLRRGALFALAAAAAVAAPVLAQRASPGTAFAKIQPGLWQFRILDDSPIRPAPVCIGDPAVLAQLRHRNVPCSRLVVAEDGQNATVHYTCSAGGYGQTALRVETPRLVQIDTQGIADNVPFAFRAEARRVGSCNPAQDRSGR